VIDEHKDKLENKAESTAGIGSVVASHYNELKETGVAQRGNSRIFHLRNFNNWIKSMLLNEYLSKLKASPLGGNLRVMDLGCGKGGDLLKWQRGGVSYVVCVDIAAKSIEQCQDRYRDMRGRNFTAEFHAADCTKQRISSLYKHKNILFDLVSCQFVFHYSFESLPQAECMLRNASENLRLGGYFIGTMPDAFDIVSRLRASGGNKFGNSLYSVTFPEDSVRSTPPLFGARYEFHLEGVVDCPEFLVHLPTLVKLADRFGLMLIGKQRFANYFDQRKDQGEGKSLMKKMRTMESYPPRNGEELVGGAEQYEHAKRFCEENEGVCGTLSKDEWEALTIYTVFAFKKYKDF